MDDLEVYLDHLGYSFPINKKEDINMGVIGRCWCSEARYGGIAVGDEVSMRDPKVNNKGTVTCIYVDPCSETVSNICYHVVWNNGMVGQYNRDQLLRTGKKGFLECRYYDDSNEAVKLYFDNKPVHINTNINVDKRPHPKFVMYNQKGADAYTTVVWKDGSHTVVKLAAGDQYDEEKAIMFAVMKKLCGDNGCEMGRYFEEFFDHEITHGDE